MRQLTLGLVLAAGCAAVPTAEDPDSAPSAPPSPPDKAVSASGATDPDAALSAFFTEVFDRGVRRSPQFQTMLGVKTNYGEWDDLSDERAQEDHALEQADLERLKGFSFDALSPASQVSYRVFEFLTERSLEQFDWRFHSYPVNQMHGTHSWTATFLINYHRVTSADDAKAYISRLRGIPAMFQQLETNLALRSEKGIVPPKFVFPPVIGSCRNLLTGKPFDKSAEQDSPLLADFRKKVGGVEGLDDAHRAELVAQAEAALLEAVAPAYQSLMSRLETMEKTASTDDGAWKFPKGDEYYSKALRWTTTTDLRPDEIHTLGLAEVERIHEEMRAIMKKVGFKGSLSEFFAFMRTDPQFYYSNDEAGRTAYLETATALIEDMKARLPELFSTFPKAELVVRRVEAFREKAAGKAFYNRPALDGSTPGIYYANLYNMADMPKYQMAALAYHEAIPGHHMQIALTQELENLPKFRKFTFFTAYTEGWALYTELVPKEMGLYEDPYSDFGRLAMELWRACRLVVDTGLHSKRWTREKAIAYLEENTPNPRGDVVKAIERYIVMPSQATAYKIGMLRILQLRADAKRALGSAFDIREFHDVVLRDGPLPLTLLEAQVDGWVASKKSPQAMGKTGASSGGD